MRNVTEDNITEAVLQTIANTRDARLKEIMTSLIRHLHSFVREVHLTQEEWLAAIDFLTRTGATTTAVRNEFILASDTLGVSSLVSMLNNRPATGVTETSLLGPFYIDGSHLLEVGATLPGASQGEAVVVTGRVITPAGTAIAGALLDVWQNAPNGLYENQDPEQPESHLRCRMYTDAEGCYQFTTAMPVAYTVPYDGPVGEMLQAVERRAWRPAHIHVRVSAAGYKPLTTALYLAHDEHIDEDAVFGVRQSLLVSPKPSDAVAEAARYHVKPGTRVIEFDVGLQPVA
jgi:protocatechuate 3,4-dioxygenase beta subunit